MRLAELAGVRVALLGLGADVAAALDAVLGAGTAEVRLVLDDPRAAEPEAGSPAATLRRVSLAEAASWAEVFVRSPGFPRNAPPLVAARARGARTTTPLDLWMGTHGPDRTVVAITGTKGKSTVTELVGRLAAAHGLRVGVAGNLGPPVFSDTWDHTAPTVVLEVSSYQAADLHHVPDLAVLTHLSQDHVSWHGSLERYVADKLRVVVNEAGTAPRVLVGQDGGTAERELAARHVPYEVVRAPVVDPELPPHRVRNAALAVAVLAAVGGPPATDEAVVEASRSSMPGRLDRCPGPDGLLCLDDALASNPTAAAAALAWLRGLGRPTVVLVGGQDRQVDPAPLRDEVRCWSPGRLRAVTLPDTGPDLARACGLAVTTEAGSVAEAVAAALRAVPAGGAVILSPGAPTPERFGNWQDRSTQFRTALVG
jgi:UDP-N-acetylmuramoylalanine--D-glutamate ligase